MMNLLFALVVANILSFLWSVLRVFKKEGEFDQSRYRLLQVLSLATWISAVSAFWRVDESTIPLQIVGIVGQLASLLIFWTHTGIVQQNRFSLIFSNDIPERIVENGLYRWIRHPFYLCYLLSYYSLSAALLDWPMLVSSLVMTAVYWSATRFEEEKILASRHGHEYQMYLQRTGRFFPRLLKK